MHYLYTLNLFVRDVLKVMKPTVGAQQSQGNSDLSNTSNTQTGVYYKQELNFSYAQMNSGVQGSTHLYAGCYECT